MATSIIINVTSNGEKRQRTVTNVDSQATNNQLIEFAGKMVALSTDTYVNTVRIDKTELTWTEASNNG